jgi:hypothetical protein
MSNVKTTSVNSVIRTKAQFDTVRTHKLILRQTIFHTQITTFLMMGLAGHNKLQQIHLFVSL